MIIWSTFKRFGGWEFSAGSANGVTLYAVHRHDHDPNNGRIYANWNAANEEWVGVCNEALKAYAENGRVAYVESGRDCDCVEYSGKIHVVDATYEAFQELEREISEWADGPFVLEIARVSETRDVRYESRDLVLEAYEEGHPHHITSRFA